jgi:hypothetical protein
MITMVLDALIKSEMIRRSFSAKTIRTVWPDEQVRRPEEYESPLPP